MTQTSLLADVKPAIEFSVAGLPITQGSKTARVVGRRIQTKYGPAVLNARAVLTEQSDMKSKTRPSGALTAWRGKVAALAAAQMAGAGFWDCYVELSCEFVIPRSPSHYTKVGRVLTKSAPAYPSYPDISKMVRAIEDAMTGVVYRDDGLIVRYGKMGKRYAETLDSVGGVYIGVVQI